MILARPTLVLHSILSLHRCCVTFEPCACFFNRPTLAGVDMEHGPFTWAKTDVRDVQDHMCHQVLLSLFRSLSPGPDACFQVRLHLAKLSAFSKTHLLCSSHQCDWFGTCGFVNASQHVNFYGVDEFGTKFPCLIRLYLLHLICSCTRRHPQHIQTLIFHCFPIPCLAQIFFPTFHTCKALYWASRK